MSPVELVKQYLPTKQIMQLATVSGEKPWICTVHYIEDDEGNLYWLSLPSRRHSQEIATNSNIAIAIAVKTDYPVVGIQMSGAAEQVSEHDVIANIMKKYVEKFNIGGQFYDNVVSGVNKHVMYKFTPSEIVLFDEVNFPKAGRQVVK